MCRRRNGPERERKRAIRLVIRARLTPVSVTSLSREDAMYIYISRYIEAVSRLFGEIISTYRLYLRGKSSFGSRRTCCMAIYAGISLYFV